MPDGRRCLWVDASAGAAGDMFLAALLDAGAPEDAVRLAIAGLGRAGLGAVEMSTTPVRRHGLRATHLQFAFSGDFSGDPPARTVAQVLEVVERAALSPAVEQLVRAVFETLAKAETAVHGDEPANLHLHEVAAPDSVCDIVGAAVALESLGLLEPGARVVVSQVAVGSGVARSAHGSIPVPSPAVLAIFAGTGATISTRHAGMELCTPTGAALLATLADEWGDLPPMQVSAVGLGAGTADPADRPNLLRAVLGIEAPAGTERWREDDLVEIEATVDDLDPRLWPAVLDDLVAAGAADAWLTPIVMRKGRPAHLVSMLAAPAAVESVSRALFASSTTLGLRTWPVTRRALARDTTTVLVEGCSIQIKRGFLDGEIVTTQPEYADVAAAAERLGKPVRWVLDRAVSAARDARAHPATGRSEE